MQGASNGSGEADRHKQIYLLTDPLALGNKSDFLHLPSLLSSCLAVRGLADGRLIFPSNRYQFDDFGTSRVGLQLLYYTFKNQQFIPIKKKTQVEFANHEDPFEFFIRNHQE
jgi:hypothetical protein